MKIGIIGGGITGLTAAYFLSKDGHEITVYEKNNYLGGLASSFEHSGWDWPIERYYHHFFTSDKAVVDLAQELNIKEKLFFLKPKTSVFSQGNFFRFDDPISLLKFPLLGITDKIRTGLTIVFLKINPFWKGLETVSASDFIKKTMGMKIYKMIWQPLLKSKFGKDAETIPASFIWTRIKKRSSSLGYFQGSNQLLVDKLKERITSQGGKIYLNHPISKVIKSKDGFEVFNQSNNLTEKFDRVLLTVPPNSLAKIVPDILEEEKKKLNDFSFLGSICLVFLLKKQFLEDKTYWLNINDENFPFLAVVEHTNFIESKHFGGNKIVYIGGYYPSESPLFDENKENLIKKFLPFLQKINPKIDLKDDLINSWLFKDPYSQPITKLNHSTIVPSVKTSIFGLYWASLHHVYPEDRGVNYAIELGKKVTDEITEE